jgi:hypothetical protein
MIWLVIGYLIKEILDNTLNKIEEIIEFILEVFDDSYFG